jgi:AcrR family transcriptional regulator
MTTELGLGLRERKKQQTRQLIAETASRLFAERGFEGVPVAEVARAANVSAGTVFNYFPTKEDLVFDGMERYEAALLEAIRHRQPGESVLTAFGRFVVERSVRLTAEHVGEIIATAARMITASPALQTREREIIARYTQSLATLIAQETGAEPDDVEPWVAANALMGVHRALLDDARRRVLAGRRSPRLAAEVRSQAERALARLERGLGAYAIKPHPGSKRATARRARQ